MIRIKVLIVGLLIASKIWGQFPNDIQGDVRIHDRVEFVTGFNFIIGDQAGNNLGDTSSVTGIGVKSVRTLNHGFLSTAFGFEALSQSPQIDKNFVSVFGSGIQDFEMMDSSTIFGGDIPLDKPGIHTLFGFNHLDDVAHSKNTIFGNRSGNQGVSADSRNNSFFGVENGREAAIIKENSLLGFLTGRKIRVGIGNSLLGAQILSRNSSTAIRNTIIGMGAGANLTDDVYDNIIIGSHALAETLQSNRNTVIGANALKQLEGASNTVALGEGILGVDFLGKSVLIGHQAEAASSRLNNVVAIGYRAKVDKSFTVRLGNQNISIITGAVPFTSSSDRRLKRSIMPIGDTDIEWIERVHPVAYYRKTVGNPRGREMGLLAQEVEALLATENGSNWSPIGHDAYGNLTLNYTELVPHLIKAIQTLSIEINQLEDLLHEK